MGIGFYCSLDRNSLICNLFFIIIEPYKKGFLNCILIVGLGGFQSMQGVCSGRDGR